MQKTFLESTISLGYLIIAMHATRLSRLNVIYPSHYILMFANSLWNGFGSRCRCPYFEINAVNTRNSDGLVRLATIITVTGFLHMIALPSVGQLLASVEFINEQPLKRILMLGSVLITLTLLHLF